MTVCERARLERTRLGGCGAFCGLSACVGETGIIGRLLSLLLLSSLKSGPALSSVYQNFQQHLYLNFMAKTEQKEQCS